MGRYGTVRNNLAVNRKKKYRHHVIEGVVIYPFHSTLIRMVYMSKITFLTNFHIKIRTENRKKITGNMSLKG